MTKYAGGSAFPTMPIYNGDDEVIAASAGMTLRDYFAAAALAGTLTTFSDYRTPGFGSLTSAQHAENAYKLADAMLAERGKP